MKKSIFLFFAAILCATNAWGAKLFFDHSSVNYPADGALVAIWSWGGSSSDAWSVFKASGATNKIVADIADGRTGGKIVRFNSSVTKPDWNASQWNSTGDISFPSDKNCLKITKWDGATTGTWSKFQLESKASITPSASSVSVGEEVTFTPALTSNQEYNDVLSTTYSVGAGATITDGKFVATEAGTYTVTATVTYNAQGYTNITKTATATCSITVSEVTVPHPVTGVTIAPTSVTIKQGATTTLTATVAPSNADDPSVTWSSDNQSVATVVNGVVTAVAAGTANITVTTVDGGFTATCTVKVKPSQYTFHAINSAQWPTVAAHYWGGADGGSSWPGADMVKESETINGFDIYSITISSDFINIMFTNQLNGDDKNKKTQDLTTEGNNGKYYDIKEAKWYASLAEVPALDPLATGVFLKGGWDGWAGTEFKKVTEEATTATITLTLDANKTFEFKIHDNETWKSNVTEIKETITGWTFKNDVGDNAKLTTALSGNYTFTWELSTSKLSITYPTEEVTITHTYTIAGVEALTGSDWKPADNNNDMTDEDGDGVYTLTKENVTLAANTSYDYKVARDHDWNDGQYPASGQPNKSISVTEDGLYKVVFTYDPTQQELNATATKTGEATIIHTVQLAGTMNSWTAEDFTVDGTTATLTKSLNAGVYEFKIVENDNYCGNDGIMTRPNSKDWTFDSGNNAKIFADITGTYTFTWNLENDKLSVTHPNLEGNYPTIAIKGTMNEWKDDANVSSSVSDGKTSIDITLEEQKTYEFKVRVGATDLGNGGAMDQGNCSDWTFNPNDGNAKITTYAAGTYTFVWEHATQKLSVTYPTGELTTLPKIYLAGAMLGNDDWSAGKKEFTADANKEKATYTYNFTERDKTYAFKIISNEAWMGNNGKMKRGNSEGWTFNGNDGNAEIYMDIPGNYIFTWEYATNKLTVTYPELPKVALRGTMCGWDEATEIELQTMDDQAHAYVKVNLEAKTYDFKIFEGDSWLSNNDAGTMDKSNNANWPFTTTQNSNTKVKIETAGNYYFIWNYAAQKLTVTYPVTIDEDAADNSKYSGYNSKIADVIVNRAFVNSYWQTITLPFSMNAAQINAMFGANTQVAKLASSEVQSKNNDDFVLNFDFVNTIDAGTPYLIKPANNVAEGAKVEGVVINTNTANITTDDAWMIAVLDKKTNSNAKDYWLAENGYLYPFNNTEIKALRAYFYFPNISTSSPVRARVAFNENVETEVENITAPEIKAIKVIQNGQLIIIRDGVKYNVQGQKL